jgi:hypothetical protein
MTGLIFIHSKQECDMKPISELLFKKFWIWIQPYKPGVTRLDKLSNMYHITHINDVWLNV